MSQTFLELQELSKSFGPTTVLRDLSLDAGEGEILALLGPSGSGKTTALRLVAGFESPNSGRIVVGGDDVTRLSPANRGFGMVFQHYALFPHMSVEENIAFGLHGQDREQVQNRVREMLDLVDLAGLGQRRVSQISGGQQQRVALARALAPKPRILLLDEPLSNLDPELRERTRREIRAAVRQVGITTVLVTHEQEEAFHVGDRVAVLHDGRLEQVGAPEELYRQPASRFVAQFVGRASSLGATLTGGRARLNAGPTWDVRLVTERVNEGDVLDVMVRPESLAITDNSGGPDIMRGTFVDRRFVGVVTYGIVRLTGADAANAHNDGPLVEVLLDSERPEAGENVSIALRPGAKPNAFATI